MNRKLMNRNNCVMIYSIMSKEYLNNTLFLNEEEVETHTPDIHSAEEVTAEQEAAESRPELSDDVEAQGVNTGILNTLRSLIQDEYEAIDGYNNAFQMLTELDKYETVAEVLRHIMLEEYAHIGELQKCLAEIDPEALQSLDSGEDEAAEVLDVEPEAISTNESLEKFYVTTYGPDYRSGPEEGGYTSVGTVVLLSKPMPSLEAAKQYVKEFEDEGIELAETSRDTVWRVEHEEELKIIAIETDATRGEYHEPARTWAESEFDYEPPKPLFNAEGRLVDPKGNLIENVQLVTCPNCHEETFNDELGLCIECGYDEKPETDDYDD